MLYLLGIVRPGGRKKKTFIGPTFKYGAGEGTWTPTDIPLDPKSSASANSATPAN